MLPPFSKRYDNPAERAFRAGDRPGDTNQLGPNPTPVTDPKDFANAFVQQRFNPDKKTFWSNSIFSSDTAEQSQQKIDVAAGSDFGNFKDPRDTQFVNDFLMKYSGPGGAIERGLVEPDRAITKESLARLVSQPGTAGASQRDPNTASKFPSQGVAI